MLHRVADVGDAGDRRREAAAAGDLTFGELDPAKVAAGIEAQALLISTDETEANGLFTISDDLKKQTLASLATSGWRHRWRPPRTACASY